MTMLVLLSVLGVVLWLGYVVLNGVEKMTRQANMKDDERRTADVRERKTK